MSDNEAFFNLKQRIAELEAQLAHVKKEYAELDEEYDEQAERNARLHHALLKAADERDAALKREAEWKRRIVESLSILFATHEDIARAHAQAVKELEGK